MNLFAVSKQPCIPVKYFKSNLLLKSNIITKMVVKYISIKNISPKYEIENILLYTILSKLFLSAY